MGYFCDDSVAVKWRLIEDKRAIFPHLTVCDNEGMNKMSCMRGQQTCPLYIKLGRQHTMVPLKAAVSPFMTLLRHPAQNYLITTETTKKTTLN